MNKYAYNKLLGAAVGATLVFYPAIQPIWSPTSSNACDTRPLTSSTNVMALNALPLKRIFELRSEDHTKYQDALAEVERKEIGAVNPVEMQKAMTRQEITGRIHPVYSVPARSGRMTDRSYALPLSEPRITNIESFSGPNYGSVIIDLSCATSYVTERAGNNQIVIRMTEAGISPSLDQKVFTLGESGLIKQIVLSGAANRNAAGAAGVDVAIDVALNSDYSVRRLPDPSRIIIELRRRGSQAGPPSPENQVASVSSSAASQSLEDEKVGSVHKRQVSTGSQDVDELMADEKRLVSFHVENRISIPYQIDNSIPTSLPPISDKTINRTIADTNGLSGAIEPKPSDRPVKCIVIDAGHGGHDPGAISPNGILEKEIVFDIAQRLRACIRARYPNVDVVLTRDSDSFITLDQRVKIANSRGADLFLSIHANASESPAASGVETYYVNPIGESSRPLYPAGEDDIRLAGENPTGCESSGVSPQTANLSVSNRLEKSEELARHLQAALVRGLGSASQPGARDRGVKPASFAVLLGTKMPSVLAEVSFLSNPRDAELLRSEQFRDRIAASLLSGLEEYLKDPSVEPPQNRK